MSILCSVLKTYFLHKKKLFCTFVDFSKAFDRVNRSGLWTKMIKNGMNGKCFNVIKSMYQHIKSCVTKNGVNSDFFSCSIGSVKGKTYPLSFLQFL